MADTDHSDFKIEERQKAYEQIVAILEMNGIAISEKTQAFMQPLLDGSMTLEEHQRIVETLLHEIEHE